MHTFPRPSVDMLKINPSVLLPKTVFTRDHRVPKYTLRNVKPILAIRDRRPSQEAPPQSSQGSRGGSAPKSTLKQPSSMAEAATIIRKRLELCVMAEAQEQQEQLEKAYSRASDKQLLREGIALVDLTAKASGRLYGDLVWRFELPEGTFSRHKFKSGENVSVRLMNSNREEGLDATLLEITANYFLLTVTTNVAARLTRASLGGGMFRVERGVQDVTTRRQMAALSQLSNLSEEARRPAKIVRAILLGSPKGPELSAEPPEWMKLESWRRDAKTAIQSIDGVNTSQRAAIAAALTRTFTLWQGPPGTGKTRTLLSFLTLLCGLALTPERRCQIGTILVVADTNAAADNLLAGLLERGINVVRVGRPTQVRPELRHACLEAVAERSSIGKQAGNLRDQAALFLSRVQEAAATGRVSEREVQQTQREAQRLWSQADRQVEEASQVVLDTCQVVVGTCASAGEARLLQRQFRVVAIDEATQATEPSSLVALTKGAECVVMAGDHAQLPPTVVSRVATENGLDIPLFARLQKSNLPALILNTQYRMHPVIASFPSKQFYGGKILSGVSAEDRPIPQHGRFSWPNSQAPVAFIPCNTPEERANTGPLSGLSSSVGDRGGGGGTPNGSSSGASYRNQGQGELALRAVRDLLGDASLTSIAILTPYNGQVRFLNSLFQDHLADLLDSGRILISTVDGYQGREADAVIFSTVRCNKEGNLGFLADARRMNVAITRARRGLVVIGNRRTLDTSPYWNAWFRWVDENDLWVH